MRVVMRVVLRGGSAIAVAAALLLASAAAAANTPAVLEFVPASGKFPVAFTATSGAVTVEEAGGAGALHCKASSSKGELTGPRESMVESTYTECSTELLGHTVPCQSSGAAAGEIKIDPLEAELVYIDKGEQKVGTVLNPKGGTYVTYECVGVTAEGSGSILSPIAPVNQAATTFTQTFSQSHGVQTPSEYENAKGEKLKATSEGKAEGHSIGTGTEAAVTTTTAEPVEIKVEPEKQEEKHEESSSQKKQEEEAAAKKHQEEEAAAKKRQEEEAAAKARTSGSTPPLGSTGTGQSKRHHGHKPAMCARPKKGRGKHRGHERGRKCKLHGKHAKRKEGSKRRS